MILLQYINLTDQVGLTWTSKYSSTHNSSNIIEDITRFLKILS
jgi:hypothetical protein